VGREWCLPASLAGNEVLINGPLAQLMHRELSTATSERLLPSAGRRGAQGHGRPRASESLGTTQRSRSTGTPPRAGGAWWSWHCKTRAARPPLRGGLGASEVRQASTMVDARLDVGVHRTVDHNMCCFGRLLSHRVARREAHKFPRERPDPDVGPAHLPD